MNLTFDEKNQTVTVANRTIKAKINQDEIVYRETGVDNRVYVSKLSRSTGNLQVYEMTNSSSNSIIDSTYQCSVRNKKF